MIYAISYATLKFKPHQMVNSLTAKFIGKADKVFAYGPNDLDQEFIQRHAAILQAKTGAGLWLWKSHICLKTFERMQDGEYLFYCDAGAYYVNRISHLVRLMEQNGQFLIPFTLPFIEEQYTKPSLFRLMGLESDRYIKTNQLVGGYFLVRKCAEAIAFFQEYLKWGGTEGVLSDEETLPLPSSFIAHRNDQSLFSLLCKKYNIPSYRDPSEWGDRGLSCFSGKAQNEWNAATFKQVSTSPYPRIVESCRRQNPLRYKISVMIDDYKRKRAQTK